MLIETETHQATVSEPMSARSSSWAVFIGERLPAFHNVVLRVILTTIINSARRAADAVAWVIRVVGAASYRFYWDDCFSRASSLAYTTLFAMVPVTALLFSMFAVFGVDETQVGNLLSKVLAQVLPPTANQALGDLQMQVFDNLSHFSKNVAQFNALSFAALVFTSIALVNTIESALNVVWRVSSNETVISKIMSFWAVITLGPLAIGVSFYWYAQMSMLAEADREMLSRVQSFVSFLIPVAATWVALTMLFFKLPSAKVRLIDAAFGAIVASVLFEIVKRAFAYYIGLSAGYSRIYGVLATIPLFLFWLYVTWVVVLFGAEVSYQSGSIKLLSGRRKYLTDLGEIGSFLGLRILYILAKNFLSGKPAPSESEIAIDTGSDPVLVRTCLDILTRAKIISSIDLDNHSRSLIVSPSKLKIEDVLRTFRSKEGRLLFHQESPEELGEAFFLEFIKRKGMNTNRDKPLSQWTLEEFVND